MHGASFWTKEDKKGSNCYNTNYHAHATELLLKKMFNVWPMAR